MKKLMIILVALVSSSVVPGCGGSGENSVVTDGVSDAELQRMAEEKKRQEDETAAASGDEQ